MCVCVVCGFRYLMQNLEWLEEQLGDYEDDYILFDCPGERMDSGNTHTHTNTHHNATGMLVQNLPPHL